MSLTPPHWHRQVNLSVQGQPGLWIEFQKNQSYKVKLCLENKQNPHKTACNLLPPLISASTLMAVLTLHREGTAPAKQMKHSSSTGFTH